ncbi:hypothetical protein U91I_00125 [alpha proteobacterium U9-1i]|nr:hypothetical protein U91I_00125 [alpha proteobacterium U9-1i]
MGCDISLARASRRALLGGALASAALAPYAGAQAAPTRILFIGNSQTYVNNVPALVQATYASVGLACETAMVAKPNFSLEDHWGDGDARRELDRGGWSFVVLQQGPSSRADSRANLRDYAVRFAPLITDIGARPALYSVWPTRDRREDFERASESYALAADDAGALLCPVAKAWRAAMQADASVQLYAPDDLHAGIYGSYLAALVIFSVLSERSPVGLPTTLTFEGQAARVPEDTAAVLQAAAASAIAR